VSKLQAFPRRAMSRTLPLAFLIFPVLISVVLHLLLLLLLLRSCYAAIVKIHYKLCSFGGPARSRHRPQNRTPAIWMRLLAICSSPCFCYVIQITYAYTVRIATHAQSDALESSAGAFVSQCRLMRVTVAPGAPPHEGA
jgi:hypothetical protein